MKLIIEKNIDVTNKIIIEEESKSKKYFIEGTFLQGAIKNQNGRVYPTDILINEVNKFNNELIQNSRAIGELSHPATPTINLDRISHKIIELKLTENTSTSSTFFGRAKIMDTPMGKIVKNFIDEGIQLGVSSRGMGSIKHINGIDEVQTDYKLITIDIVANPSAPDAFVNGIMENKDYFFDESSSTFKEAKIIREKIKKMTSPELERKKLELFKEYIINLIK